MIGAGAAGLAAAKALAHRHVDFDWFERGSMVGGLWRIDNDNGGSPAYRSLHLNSSRTATEYPSYPMPADWPDYPSHELMAQYLQKFAEHHDLLRRVTFRTEVVAVEPVADAPSSARWRVRTRGADGVESEASYDAVVIANGHHDVPNRPDLPGQFDGVSLHARDYSEPSLFTDRDVVVVGVGNSGMDIACDASRVARRVLLVTRHGVHVIPKYVFGRPADHLTNKFAAYLPFEVERAGYVAVMRASTGRPQDRGLPKPDHRLLSAHPTVSAELYDRVGHGDIVMKPGIARLAGDRIEFVDGTTTHADVLVYATGYQVSLPFLDRRLFDPVHNRMPLYLRVVSPELPGLFFLGFIQTIGANVALYEYQAEWVGDLITATAQLPSLQDQRRWIARDQAAMARRYVRSDRHTMQVDYWRYIRALKEARARRGQPPWRFQIDRALAGLR